MNKSAAYVEFTEKIKGIDTIIKLYETPTHLFVFVSQSNREFHLYNDYLKKILAKECKRTKLKKLEVICNLKQYDTIYEISTVIKKVVQGHK